MLPIRSFNGHDAGLCQFPCPAAAFGTKSLSKRTLFSFSCFAPGGEDNNTTQAPLASGLYANFPGLTYMQTSQIYTFKLASGS